MSYIFSFDRQAKEVIYDNFLFYTKSKGQALMVSLVKLVAYLSLSYAWNQFAHNVDLVKSIMYRDWINTPC
ncbi:hypothetical protein [Candidatus Tisiphia endosymbiont of Metellina segmentata]|uniref:hypothetical protein n=1 Tax=Candidatus Tisiphia endosymbiont of Metellina segmentata TaxID=3066274 RepID=UPI00313F0BF8